MEEQKFYPVKKRSNAFNSYFSIFMIILGVYGVFFRKSNQNYFFYYIFLILGVIIVISRLMIRFDKKSGIYLTPTALILRSEFVSHEIKWQDIKTFRSYDIINNTAIAIDLFDNDKYFENKSSYLRRIGKLAIKKFGTPISIVINYYDVSRTELLSELNYWLEKYR